jgi:hypothetical protein
MQASICLFLDFITVGDYGRDVAKPTGLTERTTSIHASTIDY